MNRLLYLNKTDIKGTKLHESVLSFIFSPSSFTFGNSLTEGKIDELFGSRVEAINDFNYYEPEIEKAYFDLEKGELRRLVISFIDIKNIEWFALIAYSPIKKKYELVYINKKLTSQLIQKMMMQGYLIP